MKRLIVNIDDFGLSYGINKAVFEVIPFGLVKSLSVNVNWPAAEEVPKLVGGFPEVSVCMHWNLSVGPPVCNPRSIPSLVNAQGEFFGREFPRRCLLHRFDIEDMKRELRAQLAKLRDLGAKPATWDSHQSLAIYPQFYQAALDVALETGLTMTRSQKKFLCLKPGGRLRRIIPYYARHPRWIVTHWLGGRKMRRYRRKGLRMPDYSVVMNSWGPGAAYSREAWHDMFRQIPAGVGLVACHCGYVDEGLSKYSGMVDARMRELQLHKSEDLRRLAEDRGVEPVSFAAVGAPSARSAPSPEGPAAGTQEGQA